MAQKSPSLIEIEKQLQEVEARIAADRKRRDAEMKAAIEQARRDAEAIKKLKGEKTKAVGNSTATSNAIATGPIRVPSPPVASTVGPARGNKELPDPALFLLRDLWSHLGYTGDAFVEMQMEISRELDKADFARFEREMLCNECIGARTEIHMLREERVQLTKRLELNRETIQEISETEQRTYQTLIAERGASERMIEAMEGEIRELKGQREMLESRLTATTSELERTEKGRLAALLYAKGADERASAAHVTAAAAVHVANRNILPDPTSPPVPSYWAHNDDLTLKSKLKERILAVEEEKLHADLAKVQDQRQKLKSFSSPVATPAKEPTTNNNNNNNTKTAPSTPHQKGTDENKNKNINNNQTPTQSQNQNQSHKAKKSFIMDLF